MSAHYDVVVVDVNANVIGTLENAVLKSVQWILNDIGLATFDMAAQDSQINLPQLLQHEIQIWRTPVGGTRTLIWWGVLTKAQTRPPITTFTARGLLWYTKKRFIGRAGRNNYLQNPSFEGGTFSPWAQLPGHAVTATLDSSLVFEGKTAALLDQQKSGVDTFIQQTVPNPAAALYMLSAQFFVWPIGSWSGGTAPTYDFGPAYQSRGLFINLVNPAGVAQVPNSYAIDTKSTPYGQWVRAKTQYAVSSAENGAGSSLQVRCYAPGGRISWDATELVLMESLSFQNIEQLNIFAQIMAHIQNPAFGKSNLNLNTEGYSNGVAGANSGVFQTIAYQFADHPNAYDAIRALAIRAGGFDIQESFSDATHKVLNTWYPNEGKGTLAAPRTDVTLTQNVNFEIQTYDEDGENTVTSVTMLGDGQGADRYEGHYANTSYIGGLVLEEIVHAPPNLPIDWLNSLAGELVAAKDQRMDIPSIVVTDPTLIGVIGLGDVLQLNATYGRIHGIGVEKVVSITLDPKTDFQTLALNPAWAPLDPTLIYK